jgi:putative ABC transport system substrate-binding protein
VKRREFVTLLGSAAAAWPLAARGQQPERMRRVGMITNLAENDPEERERNAAFVETLQRLGWKEGHNIRLEPRWTAGNPDLLRMHVADLVALAPDVILATGSSTLGPLLQATRTIPIVFTLVPDPVGAGFVDSLSRPGGNATGFV